MYGCAASGFTALTYAAQNGHVEAVQHLLERGADVHAAANDGACSDERGAGPWNGLLSPPTRKRLECMRGRGGVGSHSSEKALSTAGHPAQLMVHA